MSLNSTFVLILSEYLLPTKCRNVDLNSRIANIFLTTKSSNCYERISLLHLRASSHSLIFTRRIILLLSIFFGISFQRSSEQIDSNLVRWNNYAREQFRNQDWKECLWLFVQATFHACRFLFSFLLTESSDRHFATRTSLSLTFKSKLKAEVTIVALSSNFASSLVKESKA